MPSRYALLARNETRRRDLLLWQRYYALDGRGFSRLAGTRMVQRLLLCGCTSPIKDSGGTDQ